ncbi:hypothetical protein [Streptomyces bungoensis]|uniref:hypothetical protein n=1 Tax=Streptomyces bungoensis TaxID=285568 RepID=UPI0033CC6CB4
MKDYVQATLLSLIYLSLAAVTVSCVDSSQSPPQVICGTRVNPDITRRLTVPGSGYREFDRVDRSAAISAPCTLMSGNHPVLRLHFWWADGPANLRYMAEETGSVSHVTSARKVNASYEVLVGTDGAVAAAQCKSRKGDHFALTLQLPQVKPGDNSHRKDIETFIRAYFPATVKTLGCA